MPEREPLTQTLNVTEARQQFSQLLNQVFRRQARVVVEKNGIPVAAIVSTDDLDELNRLEAERQKDFAVVDGIRAAFADVPDEELEREVARAVAEARRKHREAAARGSRDA